MRRQMAGHLSLEYAYFQTSDYNLWIIHSWSMYLEVILEFSSQYRFLHINNECRFVRCVLQ